MTEFVETHAAAVRQKSGERAGRTGLILSGGYASLETVAKLLGT